MTRAEICIPRTLAHEGGYVNHPKDPGGATNKGITLSTFRAYIKPHGTIADLKAMTTAQAVIVYKQQYWDRVLGDMLPVGVDYAVSDYAVNSGPRQATKDLQRVVGATVDGAMGPETIAAVRKMDPIKVIDGVQTRRLALLKGLKGGSMWKTFGKGWAARLQSVYAGAMADAQAAYGGNPFIRPDAPTDTPSAPAASTGLVAAIVAALVAAFAFIKRG